MPETPIGVWRDMSSWVFLNVEEGSGERKRERSMKVGRAPSEQRKKHFLNVEKALDEIGKRTRGVQKGAEHQRKKEGAQNFQ
jgi:hypothetical protein